MPIYKMLEDKFRDICLENDLINEKIKIRARALETEEAIGNPDGDDFPIQKGKEKLMQAEFKNGKGQAFTDMFHNFKGTISDIISMEKNNNYKRAVFISSMNAVLNHLGLVKNTIHCKDNGPYSCAGKLSDYILENYGKIKICVIGFQPAFIETLADRFFVRAVDLDPENIGKLKNKVKIEDSTTADEAVKWADLLLVTGTTLANNTISSFPKDKTLFYGTTIAGAAYLGGFNRFCCESS